jgi:hypothetical protein
MSSAIETAKTMLVVMVGPSELSDGLGRDLRELGVVGFTTMTVNGYGAHGRRKYGILDGANIRFEIVAKPDLASRLLDLVATRYADQAVIAYASPIEAVPSDRFA